MRAVELQDVVSEPLYSPDAHGGVSDGTADKAPSFFREYKYKLEKLYAGFYTKRARQIANEKRPAAEAFYQSMLSEVRDCYANGRQALAEAIG